MNISKKANAVWLISGCSSGMGRDIALCALERGYRVVATARKPQTLTDIVSRYPDQALALPLDVTDQHSIDNAVAHALRHFGSIDVLVNNAGYGYLAALEEGDDAEVRAMFETNFFGLVALTKAVLPGMRSQQSGCILNNSSQAGLMANPGTGYYSTTKYAVEGFTEALRKEVAPFGIRVAAVEPGPFRTDWAGRSMQRSGATIVDYADTVGARNDMIQSMDGKMPGDPRKAAEAFVMLAEMENPPPQLLLGKIVLDAYRAKLSDVNAMLSAWEHVTLAADFPEGS